MADVTKYFEDVDKQLELLEQPDKEKDTKEVEKEKDTKEVEKETDNGFEQRLRKQVEKEGIIEVVKGKDGKLIARPIPSTDRLLICSLSLNAVLIVLFLTKLVNLW